MFLEPSGGGAAPKDQVAPRFAADGILRLHAVTQNRGQGHETVFPELVGRTLGIAPEQIVLATDDPIVATLMGDGVVGSRSMQQFGSAFKLGAEEVVRKGMLLAAKRLEAAPEDIEFVDGTYRVKGPDLAVGMADLIEQVRGQSPHPLDSDAAALLSGFDAVAPLQASIERTLQRPLRGLWPAAHVKRLPTQAPVTRAVVRFSVLC